MCAAPSACCDSIDSGLKALRRRCACRAAALPLRLHYSRESGSFCCERSLMRLYQSVSSVALMTMNRE